ncbi:nucleoside-diphosphate sugar epimerase/dehydratase, partial [Chloroflexus sp.]|uniref:nucleoside-diphosphate sugar epimerase/dehydratase n=1 Tax=Chloroflexus sp. TaxID=1904827 RepID=UPI003A10265A
MERLRARLIGSVLVWDLIATILCLAWSIGTPLLTIQHVILYGSVITIWPLVFIILAPQQALFTHTLPEATTRLFLAVGLAATSLAGLLYLLNGTTVERSAFVTFVALDLVVLSLIHLGFRTMVNSRRRRGAGRQTLVVGDAVTATRLADEFSCRPWTGVQIVGYASDESDVPVALPRLGSLNDLVAIVQRHQINEVIFALPPSQNNRVAELSLLLLCEPVMLHMVPTALDLVFARTPVESVGGIPLISLRESALTPSQRVAKRLFDIVVSSLLIVIL